MTVSSRSARPAKKARPRRGRRIARSNHASIPADDSRPLHLTTASTGLGWVAIVGSEVGVRRLTFGHKSGAAALRALGEESRGARRDPSSFATLVSKVIAFADGEPVDFQEQPLDVPTRTPFQWAVIERCQQIPYGETMSYGELAAEVGSPRAARAVGTVMASNPTPLIVPCHRVLASGGKIGGYSAPDGIDLKRRLLAMEADAVAGGV